MNGNMYALAAAPASVERDEQVREQAAVVVANLRTLLAEAEAILSDAQGFTLVATWLPDLARAEVHLDRIIGALARAAGLVVAPAAPSAHPFAA